MCPVCVPNSCVWCACRSVRRTAAHIRAVRRAARLAGQDVSTHDQRVLALAVDGARPRWLPAVRGRGSAAEARWGDRTLAPALHRLRTNFAPASPAGWYARAVHEIGYPHPMERPTAADDREAGSGGGERGWPAARVRELRAHLGETQEGFAGRLGTRQQTVSAWERGDSAPRRMARRLLHLVAEEHGFYRIESDRVAPDRVAPAPAHDGPPPGASAP